MKGRNRLLIHARGHIPPTLADPFEFRLGSDRMQAILWAVPTLIDRYLQTAQRRSRLTGRGNRFCELS